MKGFIMRKIIICYFLSAWCFFLANAQDWPDPIARHIIDSTKNELTNAKGNKRIDCLNLLVETYFWIWDDNDKHFDSACIYATEVYNLANKSGYKKGLGYALLWKAQCYGGRVDDNRNNNDSEANYAETKNYADQAIQIGEQIKDYRLLGDIYNMLKWLERWKGDLVKFKYNIEKAIYYYEKPVTKKLNGLLNISRCDQCQGNEKLLGNLYILLSNLQGGSFSARQSMIEKAVYYYQKSLAKSGLGDAYTALARNVMLSGNIEVSINYFNKAITLYHEDGNEYGEAEAYTNICSALFNLGDFEKGIEYSKKSIALAEKIARVNGKLDKKDYNLYQAYYWMGRFYAIANDMETAFTYLRKAQFYCPNNVAIQNCLTAIGEFHRSIGNYDSAMHYLSFTLNTETGIGKRILSSLYISMKQYDKALEIINNRINLLGNDLVNLGKTYTIAGKAYYGKNDYAIALINARQGLALLKITSRNFSLVEN